MYALYGLLIQFHLHGLCYLLKVSFIELFTTRWKVCGVAKDSSILMQLYQHHWTTQVMNFSTAIYHEIRKHTVSPQVPQHQRLLSPLSVSVSLYRFLLPPCLTGNMSTGSVVSPYKEMGMVDVGKNPTEDEEGLLTMN